MRAIRHFGMQLFLVSAVLLATLWSGTVPAQAQSLATLYSSTRNVPAGGAITLSGRNFSATSSNSSIEIHLDRRNGPVLASFSPRSVLDNVAVTIPADTPAGLHTLVATQYTSAGNAVSGTPGRVSVQVTVAAFAGSGPVGLFARVQSAASDGAGVDLDDAGAALVLGAAALALGSYARRRRLLPARAGGSSTAGATISVGWGGGGALSLAALLTASLLVTAPPAASAVGQVRSQGDRPLTPTANADPARGKTGPTLAVNPANPNHVVELHQDMPTEECEHNVSFDGGMTWGNGGQLQAPGGFATSAPGPCSMTGSMAGSLGQQAVAFGSANRVYVAWMSSHQLNVAGFSVLVSTSHDGGQTFGTAVIAAPGGISPAPNYFTPELAVDPRTPATADDRLIISVRDMRTSKAMVLRSDDGGATFTAPVEASFNDSAANPAPTWSSDNTEVVNPGDAFIRATELSQPVLGPAPANGGARPIYLAWLSSKNSGTCPPACERHGETSADGYLTIARSNDLGQSWSRTRVVNVRGFVGPMGSIFSGSAMPRLASGPSGELYMVFTQGPGVSGSNNCGSGPFPQPLGGTTRTCPSYGFGSFQASDHFINWDQDVWFIRSLDGGDTWGDLQQVNEAKKSGLAAPEITQTRMPQVFVAPDGRVDIVWHDRRHWFLNSTDRKNATHANTSVNPSESALANYACVHAHSNCPEARLGDTYYARSRNRGRSFTANRRLNDRSHNNDSGYDYRFSTYWNHGPVIAHTGADDLLVADMDARLSNYDTDSQDIFLRRVQLNATGPIPTTPLATGTAAAFTVALSQKTYPGGNEAVHGEGFTNRLWTRPVIVNEADAPSALVGGVLARANLGPVLAVPQPGLPADTQAEVSRLAPAGAYIIGDATKVASQAEAQLVAAGVSAGQIVRIPGGTPAEIAANVALTLDRRRASDKSSSPPLPAFDAVIIANPNSASAYSASVLAANRRLPILYVDQNAVPSATSSAISSLNLKRAIIVGATDVVSAAVATQLATTPPSGSGLTVTRLAGGNQYATSNAVLTESVSRGLPKNIVYVADGNEPMHAALLGAAAARVGALLTLAASGSAAAAESTLNGLGMCAAVDRLMTSDLQGTAVVGNDPPNSGHDPGPGACAPAPQEPAPEAVPSAPAQPTATAGVGAATVKWTAPALASPPTTSYILTPFKNGVAQAAINVGDVLEKTVTGLTNGASYTFTVKAVNPVGTGPASAPSQAVTPGIPTKVAITSAPATATFGVPMKVVGKLTRSDTNAAVTGQTVQLQYRKKGTTGAFAAGPTATSTSTGVVTFTTFKPSYGVELRLARPAVANNAFLPSVSTSRTILCQMRVIATLSSSSMSLGQTMTLSGSVAPSRAGKTIYLQRFNGSWGPVTSKTLSAKSTYTFAIKPGAKGTYYYRLMMKPDATFVTSYSPTKSFNVK